MDKNKVIYSSRLFGEFSPYCTVEGGTAKIYNTLAEVIEDNPRRKWRLDVAAVLSLLNFNYILGDRTLVENVWRVPWHSDITAGGDVIRRAPIPHDDIVLDAESTAKKAHDLLSKALTENIVKQHATIWLTLSGGLDSRVVAGILNEVITDTNEVRVLNWGIPNSRDTVYAKRIADRYGWKYMYVPNNPESNISLISYAVEEGGAEISPIDYNPIEVEQSILERISPDDAIIFSHYGDGIGRGEYAGVNIIDMRLKKILNPFFLFNINSYGQFKRTIAGDRALAWITDCSGSAVKQIAIRELNGHENYMRRMLTKRFKYCKKYDPFTDIHLVTFAYSLSPICRNDNIYAHILKRVDRYLYEMCWARTGISFSGAREPDHSLVECQHTKANDLLRLYDRIAGSLMRGMLVHSNIVSKPAMEYILRLWKKKCSFSMVVSKLYIIELLIRKYNLDVPRLSGGVPNRVIGYLGSRFYGLAKSVKCATSR
jgi:asparagine synthase (glutamine-hydrolysing)